ncbi:MAG: ring-cleaving dioxygenase [Chloroflexota bacterium]
MELTGMHHVTAVSGNARVNVDFYTRVLGLRLVKKTVNQDVISTYHLFFGDESGHPGTEMTFFEWPNVPNHVAGAGDVAAVAFVVPDRAALEWWTQYFDAEGVAHGEIEEMTGRPGLDFTDPEGQRLQLVAGERTDTVPWTHGVVPATAAIRGLGPVRLTVARFDPTARLLTDVLGFRQVREYHLTDGAAHPVTVFETARGGPDAEVHVHVEAGRHAAQVGIGGVHHVAFRTPDEQEHRAWQQRLTDARMGVTPVIDRYYFRSIYFREPGGVLFEIATDGPGFTADEDMSHLGERLSLPPFLESRRAEIEAVLPPLELVSHS